MGWPQCNSTLEDLTITETPLLDDHDFTFHDLALAISAAFGLVAITVSFVLMCLHATHYSRPKEQRHIIRILFMVPVYALVSFLSIFFYAHSVYYEVLRDCYEAFAIASFFSLMCAYLAEDLHRQKQYFRTIILKPWIWPMKYFQKCTGGDKGWLRTPRSGLTWFNVIFVAVFQYCFIRVSMTITAVTTQHFDRYCLESLNPAFAHVWVMVIEAIAVSITMYCIIQFYWQIKDDIAQHKPILKVLAIKLVIFLSFWQTILISFLTSSGAVNASDRIQTPDMKVGIPALLLCIEMAFFAIFHIWSFSYKPYVIGSTEHQRTFGHLNKENVPSAYEGGPLGLKAAIDCFNPIDILRSVGRAFKWLFRDRKNRMQDVSYKTVPDSQKMNDLDAPAAYAPTTSRSGLQKVNTMGEGFSLLAAAQSNPTYPPMQTKPNPYNAQDTDTGTTASPCTEAELKEYLQNQQTRRDEAHQDDNFTPVQTNLYDAKYYETRPIHPPTTMLQRPAPIQPQQPATFPVPQTNDPTTGRNQSLPFVTRQDIEATQHSQAPPYPTSHAAVPRPQAQKRTYIINNGARDDEMEDVDVGPPSSLQPGARRR